MRRHLFICYLLFLTWLPTSVSAQTGIYTTFNAGMDVSYNRIKSDKPLPPDPEVLRRVGSCFDFGIQYRIAPAFSIDVNVKTATIKTGFISKEYVRSNQWGQHYQHLASRMEYLRSSPPQLQLGFSVYPVIRPLIEWKIGAGFGPMLFKYEYDTPLTLDIDSDDVQLSAYFEENPSWQTGWVVNLNTSLIYNFSLRSAFILTLNHNQGLKNVFDYQSLQYSYRDKKNGTSEEYNVRLLSNGSYSSCTLGYSYRLFRTNYCYGKRPPIQTPRYSL